ncbi:hypothetical protein [Arthrospiribacter ruber]|uniref:Uncharacterized protein n=1 Tax=Arthrospiribacter ruber TaxID=2487934 RepID=A0A951IXZ1_9BACT|nr:hypothetical protein [Arthrospiribacter ruber]MBW3467911.1 hypothetical protein [Arthrospiribacter ruber]
MSIVAKVKFKGFNSAGLTNPVGLFYFKKLAISTQNLILASRSSVHQGQGLGVSKQTVSKKPEIVEVIPVKTKRSSNTP